MFGRKREVRGEIVESHDDMTDKVLVKIDIEAYKEFSIVVIKIYDRTDGSALFESSYRTIESERPAHYTAEAIAKEYTRANGLHIDKTLSNAELPFVGNANKRSR
ncbi:hypothetical protein [Rossellomorea sp. LjRoot5]|uniref:hypothetical protein n=1 Tax=Rossellomorea sp. LjRoot5 TaxID=3342331 RepID=UPI003ED01B6C